MGRSITDAIHMVYNGIGPFGDERDDYYGFSGLTINELRECRAITKAQRLSRGTHSWEQTWTEHLTRFEKALEFCLGDK